MGRKTTARTFQAANKILTRENLDTLQKKLNLIL